MVDFLVICVCVLATVAGWFLGAACGMRQDKDKPLSVRDRAAVRAMLAASSDALDWWELRRAADPSLPNWRLVNPADGSGRWFEPPELHGYFVASFKWHCRPASVIAARRCSDFWQRLIELYQDLIG